MDIIERIEGYNVAGFFYGWNDIFGLVINKIASPNKDYSYINIGIPIIMRNHMNSLNSCLGNKNDSIYWFEGYQDFEKPISNMKIN